MIGGFGNKASVIINHTKEPLEFLDGGWSPLLPDGLDSFGEGSDAVLVDLEAKEFKGRLPEYAFAAVNDEAVFVEDVEDSFEVFEMLLRCFGSDQDVVDIHEGMRDVAENFVHEPLKVLARIFKAKRSAGEQVQAERSYNPCFLDIIIVYGDLVISFEQVNFAKDLLADEV